jgi:hypothetical protein
MKNIKPAMAIPSIINPALPILEPLPETENRTETCS